jgi:NADPH-dependent 2,4-dienoyl-CoA reductase/sulfur reductase-like enzyme
LGKEKVERVRWTDGRAVWEEAVDILACGFHLVPNTELAQLLGCELHDGIVVVDIHQKTTVRDVFAAGEVGGIAGVDAALLQGQIAGLAAAERVKVTDALLEQSSKEVAFGKRLCEAFALRPELAALCRDDTIVCRCEDVTYGQLRVRFSWTEAKLHTRCGMGACQGRICGSATETLFGWHNTAIRPPIYPALISTLCSGDGTQIQTQTISSKERG